MTPTIRAVEAVSRKKWKDIISLQTPANMILRRIVAFSLLSDGITSPDVAQLVRSHEISYGESLSVWLANEDFKRIYDRVQTKLNEL